MPIDGEWRNPGVVRCYRKKRYPNWVLAEAAAEKASVRTGELIIAYECPDCGKFHIGHADKAQQITRQPPVVPAALLPTLCPRCGQPIAEERRLAAKESGNFNVYCSRKCSTKGTKMTRNQRNGRIPEFLKRMNP